MTADPIRALIAWASVTVGGLPYAAEASTALSALEKDHDHAHEVGFRDGVAAATKDGADMEQYAHRRCDEALAASDRRANAAEKERDDNRWALDALVGEPTMQERFNALRAEADVLAGELREIADRDWASRREAGLGARVVELQNIARHVLARYGRETESPRKGKAV